MGRSHSDEDDDYDMGSEPDFSDDEDFVDDISDAELMPDLLKQKPKGIDFLLNYIKLCYTGTIHKRFLL